MQNQCASISKQGFLKQNFLESFGIFDIEFLLMSPSPSLCVYGKNEISFLAEKFFP